MSYTMRQTNIVTIREPPCYPWNIRLFGATMVAPSTRSVALSKLKSFRRLPAKATQVSRCCCRQAPRRAAVISRQFSLHSGEFLSISNFASPATAPGADAHPHQSKDTQPEQHTKQTTTSAEVEGRRIGKSQRRTSAACHTEHSMLSFAQQHTPRPALTITPHPQPNHTDNT